MPAGRARLAWAAMKFSVAAGLIVLAAPAFAAEQPIPVAQEPRHKVALENAYVRVIDVHIPPGDTSLYHVHVIPSVVVELTHSLIVSQTYGQAAPPPRQVEPGESRYAPYDSKPLTHRVTNRGEDVFHVLDIELLHPGGAAFGPPIEASGTVLAWAEKTVRSYRVSVPAGARCAIAPAAAARLVVAVSGAGSIDGADLPAQAYRFFEPGRPVEIEARGGAADYVLLELN